jgi:hypothetical protein
MVILGLFGLTREHELKVSRVVTWCTYLFGLCGHEQCTATSHGPPQNKQSQLAQCSYFSASGHRPR